MAAVADPKENLACLAFAYFLKNPDYKTNSEQHKEEWINIFKDFKITQLSSGLSSPAPQECFLLRIRSGKQKLPVRGNQHLFAPVETWAGQ